MIKVRLNELLEQKRKTLYWLAQESGLTYPTLHKLAKGETQSIRFDTLEKIMDALEVEDVNDILVRKA